MDDNLLTIDGFQQRLIEAIAFALPFSLFCLDLGGGGESKIEPAQVFALLLLMVAVTVVLWQGRFQCFQALEKIVLLCLGVSCLSLLAAQMSHGVPAQLAKGIKQIIGIAFVVMMFVAVRRYLTDPESFRRVCKWLWRGCLVLALFGIWQSIAFNLLDISFLADWSKVEDILGHSFLWWTGGRNKMGAIIRVNSFATEPAHYCQMLMLVTGLVIFRVSPPPFIRSTSWEVFLPSLGMAIIFLVGYLLSFSLVGFLGFIIVVVSHSLLFRMITFRRICLLLLSGSIIIVGLSYLSQGQITRKAAGIVEIIPQEEKETTYEALSALVLAMHIQVTWGNLQDNPFLGCGIGGHESTFSSYAPDWVYKHRMLQQLNLGDAGSMALRLLSEMGLLGFSVFCLAFAMIIWPAWQAVRRASAYPQAWKMLPLCAGVLTSAIAVVLIFLVRMGNYFFVSFWFLLALVSVIPEVLAQVTAGSSGTEADHGGAKATTSNYS